MISHSTGRIVLPVANGVRRHLKNTLRKKSGSQDSETCESVQTKTKVEGTNDANSALTTCTTPPCAPTECLNTFANELPWHEFPPPADDDNWVCVDWGKDLNHNPWTLYDGYVFGSVPSCDEVQEAVSSLQGFLDQSAGGEKDSEAENIYDSSSDLEEGTNDESSTTDSSSVSDWIEPSMQLCCPNKSGMLQQKQGFGVVLEALYMMQHEPMVKKMVTSLSTDKAVWEAMLNNEVVKGIRESLTKGRGISSVPSKALESESEAEAEAEKTPEAESESESANILSSFMHNLKAKIGGLINALKRMMISMMLRERSDQATAENSDATKEELTMRVPLRVPFTLTMIVFLTVVLKRMNKLA